MAGSQTVQHFQKLDDQCSESRMICYPWREYGLQIQISVTNGKHRGLPSYNLNYNQPTPRNIPEKERLSYIHRSQAEPQSISETHRK
jgi:hypothetical protein